jgi:hypothetical protein
MAQIFPAQIKMNKLKSTKTKALYPFLQGVLFCCEVKCEQIFLNHTVPIGLLGKKENPPGGGVGWEGSCFWRTIYRRQV